MVGFKSSRTTQNSSRENAFGARRDLGHVDYPSRFPCFLFSARLCDGKQRSMQFGPSRPNEMNRWNIPISLETEIRKRDKCCVYCRAVFRNCPHARGVPKDK